MLQILDKVAKKLKTGDEVKKEDLEKIVDFLQNFADKCHHGKEEDFFFPSLQTNETNKKLINELLGEHKISRDYIRQISESINDYHVNSLSAERIALTSRRYIELLTSHIRKENLILFPAAQKELAQKLLSEIGEKFEKFEKEVIGEGKHEEYHQWLNQLRASYLT